MPAGEQGVVHAVLLSAVVEICLLDPGPYSRILELKRFNFSSLSSMMLSRVVSCIAVLPWGHMCWTNGGMGFNCQWWVEDGSALTASGGNVSGEYYIGRALTASGVNFNDHY